MKKNIYESTGQLNKETKVHHIFEVISGKYDLMNNVISLFLHKKWRRDAIKKIGIEEGTRLIDLCCGTGVWTVDLAQQVGPNGMVYGMDFSQAMLNYLYMRYLVPFLGFVLAKRFNEFRWLQESTWLLPEKEELVLIFCNAGFEDITITEFLYGVVSIYTMVKRNI